jgi:hypothetical protein
MRIEALERRFELGYYHKPSFRSIILAWLRNSNISASYASVVPASR